MRIINSIVSHSIVDWVNANYFLLSSSLHRLEIPGKHSIFIISIRKIFLNDIFLESVIIDHLHRLIWICFSTRVYDTQTHQIQICYKHTYKSLFLMHAHWTPYTKVKRTLAHTYIAICHSKVMKLFLILPHLRKKKLEKGVKNCLKW